MWPQPQCPRQKFKNVFCIDSAHEITDEAILHRERSIESVLKSPEHRYYKCSQWLIYPNWFQIAHGDVLRTPSMEELRGLRKREWEKRIIAWRACLKFIFIHQL